MAVMVEPRGSWTDERLDNLSRKVDDGFAGVANKIKRLDENLSEQRRGINTRFEAMDLRFDSLNRSLQAIMVAIIVALISGNAL